MLQVVLVYPEIPPNTGNIARTCAATQTKLHLVEPLGFEISDRYLKRAGLDYWPYVNLQCHPSWTAFQEFQRHRGGRLVSFSTSGTQTYLQFQFRDNDWLIFGSESSGLPANILQICTATLRIPMAHHQVRSLNLSVSAAIGLFEARRQLALTS